MPTDEHDASRGESLCNKSTPIDIEHLLQDRVLHDLWIEHVVSQVRSAIDKERSNKRSVLLSILGLSSFIILSTAAYFHQTIVERAASSAVEARLGEMERKVEAADLSLQITDIVNRISSGDSFTNSDRDTTMRLLDRAAKLQGFSEREGFTLSLERFVDALFAASLDADIDRIESVFRKQIENSRGIMTTLATHYGRNLLESAGAPADWQMEDDEGLFSRYRRYTNLVRTNGYPEVRLLNELLVNHILATEDIQDESIVFALISEIDDLKNQDRDAFWRMIEDYANNRIAKTPTAETNRVAQRTLSFLTDYQQHQPKFVEIIDRVRSDIVRDPRLTESFSLDDDLKLDSYIAQFSKLYAIDFDQLVMDILPEYSGVDEPTTDDRLEAFIDILFERGFFDELDIMDKDFRSRIDQSPGIAATVFLRFAQELMSYAPSEINKEFEESTILAQRYRDLSNRLMNLEFPELAILHEMILAFIVNPNEEPTSAAASDFFEEIASLNQIDQMAFWSLLEAYALPSGNLAHNSRARVIKRIVIDFLRAYRDEHSEFARLLERTSVDELMTGQRSVR